MSLTEHGITKYKEAQKRADELKNNPDPRLSGEIWVFGGDGELNGNSLDIYPELSFREKVKLFKKPGAALYRSILLKSQKSRGFKKFKGK